VPQYDFDLVVIGSGPAGEKAAIEASKLNKSAAIVERRSVQGGVCIHTGTIPSKTLGETAMYIARLPADCVRTAQRDPLRSVDPRVDAPKDQVMLQELDVINRIWQTSHQRHSRTG
jgi:pyruvate/2-oxoglutarate dehydrogenase complex dihydrolipoamide dehydrogenase (E3) component